MEVIGYNHSRQRYIARFNLRAFNLYVMLIQVHPFTWNHMPNEPFSSKQALNNWVAMLHATYGASQNYSKTSFEVLSHLTEVSALFGKFLFKKKDVEAAQRFLPKIFAWAVALLKTVRPAETDLEQIVLRKFPRVCSYCMKAPCCCWKGEKPSPDAKTLRQYYFDNGPSQKRGLNDFEGMFITIYGESWLGEDDDIRHPYLRLMEELAELAEAIRFHHLYPENFDNELADFFAWWFALSVSIKRLGGKPAQIEDLVWASYPGQCLDCNSMPCFCSPMPVRELMSKPAPGQHHQIDPLTSLFNQGAYKADLARIASQELKGAFPIGCVRMDVDKFKAVNDTHGHSAGDAALAHIAAVLRKKVRPRDRVYRISGDEFGALLIDSTEEEAYGLMKRVVLALDASPVRWVDSNGTVKEFPVSISVGVAQCDAPKEIDSSFELADKAAYVSKDAGRKIVTKASSFGQQTS